MPRKATAPKVVAEETVPAEGTRRSSRIADKPASRTAAPKKAPASRAKRTVEKDAEDEKAEPAAKKSKHDSDSETAEEGPSAVAETSKKPASKAAAKPASSAAKPASSAKPASKAKPVSKRATRHTEPSIPEEDKASGDEKAEGEDKENKMEVDDTSEAKAEASGKDVTEVEDKENEKEEVKAAAAEAEDEVGELEIGDGLPNWTMQNEKNEDVKIGSLAGENGLVLFLIPKADTPGCNTQACAFRDSYAEFEKYGYAVYALSADTPAVQAKWQTKKNLPYSLLSDPKRKVIHTLGAKNGSTTKRSHLIFEKGSGKLVEKRIGVKPADSHKQALEFIKKHHPEEGS